jgi:thymidylate synthase (FAD)
MEITTTRDIARQLLRHRSFSFQEWSNRYANPLEELGFETRDARLQDVKNRQNSVITEDKELQDLWVEKQQEVIHAAKDAYTWAVSNNIAKEQARSVLPEGNTVSRLYMAGTLRSFLHYIDVRTDISTQLEHRELAESIKQEVNKVFNLNNA